MGYWGTGISSNDTFEDIKNQYFDFYNDGLEPHEITRKIIDVYQEILYDKEEAHNFWFAIALCQWECKSLEPELLERITRIIESGEDIKLWIELGAEKSEITKRKKVLNKFLGKLHSYRKSPKRRKKQTIRDSIFKKGDCLSVKLSNGSFGAAFVLESEEQTEYGLNLMALCDYNSDEPPTIEFFNNALILISKTQESPNSFKDRPLICWCMADFFKPHENPLDIVGSMATTRIYNIEGEYKSFVQWTYIPTLIEDQPTLVSKYGPTHIKLELNALR